MTHVEYILATTLQSGGKVLLQFNGTPSAPSWMGHDRSGRHSTISHPSGIMWRLAETYYSGAGPVHSTATGDGFNPPTTGWPAGYSVEFLHLSPPAPVHPVSPIASPIALGFTSFLTKSKSHDIAFALKDGSTVTAHRVIIEAQAPTLLSIASEASELDAPISIPYDKGPFNEMMNITYGKPPSLNLNVEQLVDLLKVSNYCGAIASKLHAEDALSRLIDPNNCWMLGDLSCALVCPLLFENCSHFFITNEAEVMNSEGWKIAKNNVDLPKFLSTAAMQPPVIPSVLDIRCQLMVAPGCKLADLDGSKQALVDNLERLTHTDAPPLTEQKTDASSSSLNPDPLNSDPPSVRREKRRASSTSSADSDPPSVRREKRVASSSSAANTDVPQA
jgi:hypothetical protein